MRLPSLRTASTLNLLLGLWSAGEILVLSLYLQQIRGDSPLVTGLAIAPQGVIGFAAGAFGARLGARMGIRAMLVLCGATATAGFLVLTQLPAGGHSSLVLAAVMLVGFGTAGTTFGTMVTAPAGWPRTTRAWSGMSSTPAARSARLSGRRCCLPWHLPSATVGVSGARAAMLTGALVAALATLVAWRDHRGGGKRAAAQAADGEVVAVIGAG